MKRGEILSLETLTLGMALGGLALAAGCGGSQTQSDAPASAPADGAEKVGGDEASCGGGGKCGEGKCGG